MNNGQSKELAAVMSERSKIAVEIIHLEEAIRQKRERFKSLSFYMDGFATANTPTNQHEED